MFLYGNGLGFKLGHMNPILSLIKVLLLLSFSVMRQMQFHVIFRSVKRYFEMELET